MKQIHKSWKFSFSILWPIHRASSKLFKIIETVDSDGTAQVDGNDTICLFKKIQMIMKIALFFNNNFSWNPHWSVSFIEYLILRRRSLTKESITSYIIWYYVVKISFFSISIDYTKIVIQKIIINTTFSNLYLYTSFDFGWIMFSRMYLTSWTINSSKTPIWIDVLIPTNWFHKDVLEKSNSF